MTPRWCFFVNALARNGRAAAQLEAMLKHAPASVSTGARIEIIGEADLRATLSALPPSTWPVAVGGDGTVNLLVRSLRDAGLGSRPFGVLPLGSGNAFAHAIGIGNVRRALLALARARVQSLDVMVSNHPTAPVALVSMSAGFESGLLGELSTERAWRRWSRVIPGLIRHGHRGWNNLDLNVDGDVVVSAHETVYNVGCTIFLLRIRQGDVARRRAQRWSGRSRDFFDGAFLLARARDGGQDAGERGGMDPRWQRWRTARFASPVAFQIDGEVVAGGAYDVRVEPRAINVVTG
jgi:diacylglycerol kinase family enzyme